MTPDETDPSAPAEEGGPSGAPSPVGSEAPGPGPSTPSAELDCADVVEALPLHLLGSGETGPAGAPRGPSPSAVVAHLDSCAPCAAEHRFLAVAVGTRPHPPHDLGLRILTRALAEGVATPLRAGPASPTVHARAPQRFLSWSGTAAAAVLVLAFGIGLVARGTGGTGDGEPVLLAALEDGSYGWWGDEWMVAGAPYLEGLSDETLVILAGGGAP